MKRCIHVGAGVRDQLDLADLKGGDFGILLLGGLAGQEIANNPRRQTLVRNHAMFNGVAEIDVVHENLHVSPDGANSGPTTSGQLARRARG